jgi:hypothetical protein
MSDSKTLSYCDDFACPIDAALYGLPRAKLVDGTTLAKSHNQFTPDEIVQDPEPGTRLKSGSNTTNVTIRATNSETNETRSCVWKVSVPPLTRLATVEFRVDPPCGPFQETGVFYPDATATTNETRALSGQVRKIRGFVPRNASGIPAMRAIMQDADGSKITLTLRSNETRVFVTNLSIPVAFTSNGANSLAAKLDIQNDTLCTRTEPFVAKFVLLGQANETIPTYY